MDDILNIDECLSDSFSLSSDTDIRNIVDQWKQGGEVETENQKFVDTRTFTRPKKRLFSNSDVNNAFINSTTGNSSSYSRQSTRESMGSSTGSVEKTMPMIDLKIGGLVTSMQRSYLGDVSPPNTVFLESSSTMGNSLITSSDFANVDDFINGEEDSLSMTHFNNYKLSDAINDRNFLERLTNYDESLFTKDADLENIDVNQLLNGSGGANGSANSTLRNSVNETITDKKCNGNLTFDASPSDSNKTFVGAPKDTTFGLAFVNNKTFSPKAASRKTSIDTDASEREDGPLNDTFKVGNTLTKRSSLDADHENESPKLYMGSPLQPITTPRNTDVYQSTPSRNEGFRKNIRSDASVNISPILSETPAPANKNQTQANVDKFIDVEIDEFEPFLRKSAKTSDKIKLRDAERQSLANFEEFENTLLLLENNKNEEEFDKILNSFTNNGRSPINLKLRQSLNNIKKRNSLNNFEKQHHDELNREKSSHSNIGDTTLTHDKNKSNESFNKSPMVSSTSSSSSGERLLRRSRLYDDVMSSSGSLEKQITGDNCELNTSFNKPPSNATLTLDNKEITENNGHIQETQNHVNTTYGCEQTESNLTSELNLGEVNDVKQGNRDRFKTIRIFKKPPENAAQIPDINDKSANKLEKTITNEHFSQINTNSPKSISATEQKAINTMTFKKSALARPKYLSGIAKRDVYAKSNSHELLSSNDNQIDEMGSQPKVSALKSPMGYKSKSIHNLASTNKIALRSRSSENEKNAIPKPHQLRLLRPSEKSSSALSIQSSSNDGNLFKVPIGNPLGATRLTSLGPKKLSLVRPSSGYYNYNGKRFENETESTQFVSSNSLSSNSSKGSETRNDLESNSRYTVDQAPNETFIATPVNNPNIAKPVTKIASGIPKPQIKRSGLPRPTTFTKR